MTNKDSPYLVFDFSAPIPRVWPPKGKPPIPVTLEKRKLLVLACWKKCFLRPCYIHREVYIILTGFQDNVYLEIDNNPVIILTGFP